MTFGEMKEVKGGIAQHSYSCMCTGQPETPFWICPYSTPTGSENCTNAIVDWVNGNCDDPGLADCAMN